MVGVEEEDDLSDTESVTSVASMASEGVPEPPEWKLIKFDKLVEFLDTIKGSKKILDRCLDFCSDARLLSKSFKKLRQSSVVTVQEKSRIHKIEMKLLFHRKGNFKSTPSK